MKCFQGALLALLGIGLFVACKKEKKENGSQDEHDAVTTVEIWLIQGADTIRGRYKDPDGPGGRLPVIDTLRPAAGQRYTYAVRLLNESVNPSEDLTAVIFEQEKNTHMFFLFLEPDTTYAAILSVDDRDDLGRPVGGRGTYEQRRSGLGSLHCVLKHYLNPADKNRALEAGSTDIDIRLPVIAL